MLIIKETDFEMVQSLKTGPFFDLSLPTVINEGKDNERTEMKLIAHGLPFETCMKHIVGIKMSKQKDFTGNMTVREYIDKYKQIVDEVSKLIKDVEWPKRTKKVEDGESDD